MTSCRCKPGWCGGRMLLRVSCGVMIAALTACPPAESQSECACEAGCPGGTIHSADTTADYLVSLPELLRLIQFYNAGGYSCTAGATEDGFVPGPGNHVCPAHASDYAPQDWAITLTELLRLIQFYNAGGYHACMNLGTEDGFCPGSGLALPEPPKRPIAVGVEYALPGLAPAFSAMDLPAVKFLPEQYAWDKMQPSAAAAIDFAKLDQLVLEYQCAGYSDITLGLIHQSSWASIDPAANFAPKPEFHGLYQAWVSAIVERYDFDGVDDMPGLLGPINRIEVGVEFSSYEPGPVDDYLTTLELAYTAAHAASNTVKVYHVAFFLPGVFDDDPAPEDFATALQNVPERIYIPAYEDFQAILDRPDIFDGANLHFLSWPQEIVPALRWLHYEMARRGYAKPVIVSDTLPSPFAGFGISTTCTGLPNLLALIIRPALESDRCRLADYFTNLVAGNPDTLAWVRAHTGADMVRKTLIAASEGVELSNASFMQDLPLNQPGATAGNAGWGGMVDAHPDLINQVQVVTRLRAPFYALQQLGQHFVGYDTVTREDAGNAKLYLYALRDSEALHTTRWVAWYDPGILVLPGDPIPQTTLSFAEAGPAPVVTRVITAEDQTMAEAVAYDIEDGVPLIPLDSTPVYIVP